MKLIESSIYALILFVGVYVVISVAMRVFEWTTVFYAHVIGGVAATVIGVGAFVLFLLKKK